MRRAAIGVGIAAALLVEIAVLFGGYILASIRCCTSGGAAAPAGPEDWATIAIFAVVMLAPAGIVGAGVAMIAEGVARGIEAFRRDR